MAVTIVPAAAALSVARRTEGLPRYRLRLLVGAVGVFLLMGNLAGGYVDIPFGGLAFSVTLIGMAAIDLGIQGRRGMFQFLLVLIGVRFLIFYVLYVGGLALTAAGLIGSGLLILLVAWGWHRNRSRLQGWLEGMAP